MTLLIKPEPFSLRSTVSLTAYSIPPYRRSAGRPRWT